MLSPLLWVGNRRQRCEGKYHQKNYKQVDTFFFLKVVSSSMQVTLRTAAWISTRDLDDASSLGDFPTIWLEPCILPRCARVERSHFTVTLLLKWHRGYSWCHCSPGASIMKYFGWRRFFPFNVNHILWRHRNLLKSLRWVCPPWARRHLITSTLLLGNSWGRIADLWGVWASYLGYFNSDSFQAFS